MRDRYRESATRVAALVVAAYWLSSVGRDIQNGGRWRVGQQHIHIGWDLRPLLCMERSQLLFFHIKTNGSAEVLHCCPNPFSLFGL